MKKLITKFWGVALVIVLVSSLFIAASPVSGADPLNWEMKVDAPSALFKVLAPGTTINDYAIAPNGMTMYAAVTNTVTGPGLLQTTLGGGIWSDITARLPGFAQGPVTAENIDIDTVDFVAMAPDDANVVVALDASSNGTNYIGAAISVDGGATFSSMGQIGALTNTQLAGVEVSPLVTGGVRYIALYGRNGATDTPILLYYNYGAGVGAWVDAVTSTTWTGYTAGAATGSQDDILAMAFSPNFPSDYMAVAIRADSDNATTASGSMSLHILSFSPTTLTWDASVSPGYPVTVTSCAAAVTDFDANSASVALLPDYDGSDESLRIAFVGASIVSPTATEAGGIWRCYDNAPAVRIAGTATAGIGVNSVAFDGTNLAAGLYATNDVYRSADPLSTAPTFLPARSLKKIGIDDAGNDEVLVTFVGETLYGSKKGTAGALSKSVDYGYTWNDFTVINSGVGFGPGTVDDIYMTDTGDPWYIAAHDGTTASIYRISMFALQRVLCVAESAGAPDFTLRGLAGDPKVVYAVDEGGTDMYYTSGGGLDRWYKRTCPAAVTDIAVESQQVVYIGSGINVYKSVNAGFTWALPVNCKLAGFNVINTMLSLGENKLVVGGSAGGVCWSKDGGASWFPAMGVIFGGPVQIAATGLETGDYVFAAEESNTNVWRCEISPANFLGEFKSMNAPAAVTAEVNRGMLLKDGVLYVLSANSTATYLNRTLAPAIPGTHTALFWGTQYGPEAGVGGMVNTPSALRASSGAPGSIMLYGIDNNNAVWWFDDSVALGGPSLIAPADGARIDIISPLTGAVANVNFTWDRMSLATSYYLFIALDAGFTELIGAPILVTSSLDPVSSIQAGSTFQPGTTYYWRVATNTPLTSAFSETRSYVVQPTAASVPTIASPENGATIDNTSPAFSWTPAAGSTMYQFQLSDDPAFATTLVDEQLEGAGIAPAVTLERGKTYFWRVRSLQPVEGDWSTVANFTVAKEVVPTPPVVVETVPPPVIEIPPAPPAQVIEIPPAPAVEKIAPAYIWAIIIIGAVLVIAVIVLIVRTRRSV